MLERLIFLPKLMGFFTILSTLLENFQKNQVLFLVSSILIFTLVMAITTIVIYKTIVHGFLFSLFSKGDSDAIYRSLEKEILKNRKFFSKLLFFYILVCMRLEIFCRLKGVETLARSQGKSRFIRFAYIFSVAHLVDTENKDWKKWYTDVLLNKKIVHEKIVRFDYALKLMSEKFYSEALVQFSWLLDRRLCSYMKLLTVYSIDMLCFKLPDLCATKDAYLKKEVHKSLSSLYKKFILKGYHPKFHHGSGIGIRMLILKNLTESAYEWLKYRIAINTTSNQ